MKNVKKVFLFLTVLSFVLIAVGCGKKEAAQSGGEVKSVVDFKGYPMDAEAQTVTWLQLGGDALYSRFSSVNESPIHQNYSKMTGVHIEWIMPTAGATAAQIYATTMASGDLPDIICYSGQATEAERLLSENTIWDLSPYLERYSPNYWKLLKENPIRDKAGKTDSGKYWRYSFFREEGPFEDTWVGPIVRKDWLDAQGLPMPKTIPDWDKTLQTFKDKYGAFLTLEPGFLRDHPGLCGAFGAYAGYAFSWYVDSNQKVKAAQAQPEWRNYMAKLHEWYQKGLLDPDHLTQDQPTFRSKAVNGQTGLTIGALSRVTQLVGDAAAAKNGAEWVGAPYPRAADGSITKTQGNWGVGGDSATITTAVKPERLELVMRVMDYGYSPEGFIFQNYGIEGESWERDASGTIVWTPLVLNDPDFGNLRSLITKYSFQAGSNPGLQATHLVELINFPITFEAGKIWFYENEDAAYKSVLPPGMSYTIAETDRITELTNAINTYSAETATGFVTGQVPLSEFDNFVARLKQMGLEEAQKIQQDSLDRYNSR
ncbi:MAG: extracellular solute-binding protein [Treponema sp.]|nr:extracellular solute-binding protein [Treponema sp.]